LVDRRRVPLGKVEKIYSRKEQETRKEGKQSVKKGVLSKVIRNLMGRGMNREDE